MAIGTVATARALKAKFVKNYQNSNDIKTETTIQADCSCAGSLNRWHTNPECPLLEKDKE